MKFKLKTIPSFDAAAAALIKKYPSFKNDLILLKKLLEENPKHGVSLGNFCYKIRLAILNDNKANSGTTKVITHLVRVDQINGIIYLLSIYDRFEQGNNTDNHLKDLLRQIR